MTRDRLLPRVACAVALAATLVFPVFPQGTAVTLVANQTYGINVQYSDVWYHRELGFIGSWTGPGKVVIVDPMTATPIGTYFTSNGSVVRDLQAQGTILYVALDSSGFDVVDIANPAAPVRLTTFTNGFNSGVHDLFIHGNTLYAVEDVSNSNVHIIDVTNPAAPVRLTTFDNPGGCHDLTVVGNRAYLANLSGGFQIVDVTNPAAPVSLAIKNYPGSFTHNIWPNGDGRYVATTDETCSSGHLRIWDVSDLANIVQVGEYSVPNQGNTCVHNAMWVDNYIYMSYYLHGLRIVDATNPAAPVEVGNYGTHAHFSPKTGESRHDEAGGCFDGAWGVYAERSGANATRVFVSDIGSGFWSFEFTGAQNLALDGVGLYNQSNGVFYLRDQASDGPASNQFQYGPVQPLVGLAGDWDGNGSKTVGLFDPATGIFYLKNSNTHGPADLQFQYGPPNSGWVPIVGDWDGNDTETVGLYDPATGIFYLRNTNNAGPATLQFQYGPPNLQPLAGDWDNSGADSIGLYDKATGVFYLRNSNSAGIADLQFVYGFPDPDFKPLAGNWDGHSGDSVGLYRTGTGLFYLRNANDAGPADLQFQYGPASAGYMPIVGDWRGPGF